MSTDVNRFPELKDLLSIKRKYLLRLMENDNLMESEHFSQLLLAIMHLSEELQLRPDLQKLEHNDYAHINEDVKRMYILLIEQWFDYLSHLQESTPYLFSLAMRTNPFDPLAKVEIK
jgi:hypothetical protein